MSKFRLVVAFFSAVFLVAAATSEAAPITDPNDPRIWQGANLGTFANLFYGSNTLSTRQQVVDNLLLDDGIFDPRGYRAGTLVMNAWANSATAAGLSTDLTGTGSYHYYQGGYHVPTAANAIDNQWIQTSGTVGQTIWDLGAPLSKAAIFNTIDHTPLPQEAIESTVYLSNDMTSWTLATTERVWLEGFQPNRGILWDGFVYAVGTGTADQFRFVSIIHGGPGALQRDGDNEINGVMGLTEDYTPPPNPVPEPTTWTLACLAAVVLAARHHGRRAHAATCRGATRAAS